MQGFILLVCELFFGLRALIFIGGNAVDNVYKFLTGFVVPLSASKFCFCNANASILAFSDICKGRTIDWELTIEQKEQFVFI